MLQPFELSGYDELTQAINGLGNLSQPAYKPLQDAMLKSVQLGEGRAKELAPVAFGNLRASIGSQVITSPDEIVGEIGTDLGRINDGKLIGYAQAVEFGSRPHWAPIQPLIEWVRVKGLAGTYNTGTGRRIGGKRRKDREDRALAYAIQRKIAQVGTQAHPFFHPAIDSIKQEVHRLFVSAVGTIVRNFGRTR